jgi:hypothetical protein
MKSNLTNGIFTLIILAALGLSGCAKFATTDAPASQSNNTDQGSTGGASDAAAWEKVEMDGYPSGGSYAKNLVIYIDKVNQSIVFVLPIPVIIPLINPMPIPELPGAQLTSYTDAQGNTNMAVSIPLGYLVKGGILRPNQKLPSGDALPFVPAGELPGFAIDFPQMPRYQVHLYVGVNVAAVFVELPDLPAPVGSITAIFPVKDSKGLKQVGAIGYVAKKGTFKGGMYLAAQLPASLARVIDDLIRW